MTENAILLVDSHHGIYVPQIFAEQNKDLFPSNLQDELKDLLIGPDCEMYWDSWDTVLNLFEIDYKPNIISPNTKYVLFQYDDLWAIPVDELSQISEM